MALLRRGIISVSLFPIGSAFRLRIPLPNTGECWFTVDSSQDIASFLEEVKNEDPFISKVHSDTPNRLFKEAADEGILININDTKYMLKNNFMSESIESKSMMSSFIDALEKSNIKNKSELNLVVNKTLGELGEQFGTYISVLKNSINEIDLQIGAIREKEKKIMRKIQFRSNVFCTFGLSFLTAQWGFFYYTIYEVDWLGWDLMEPITFTVGQLGFLYSLFYYLATKETHSYQTMLFRYESKKKQYMLRQNGVDTGRIKFLEEEKNRILSLIEVIEQRLV